MHLAATAANDEALASRNEHGVGVEKLRGQRPAFEPGAMTAQIFTVVEAERPFL